MEQQEQTPQRTTWGLIGAAALLGAAVATWLVVSRVKRPGQSTWSVDDLLSAADRAAERLEQTLIGDTAKAG